MGAAVIVHTCAKGAAVGSWGPLPSSERLPLGSLGPLPSQHQLLGS